MAVKDWSQVAATNSNADASINWAEGQAPSTVNDSARAMMAALAVWYAQISSGTIVTGTVGGTVDAITLTNSPTVPTAQMKYGSKFMFTALGTSSSTTPTLNVDGIGAKTIQYRGAALVAGDIVAGFPTLVVYDGTNFQMVNSPVSKTLSLGGSSIGTSLTFAEVFMSRNAQTGATHTIATSDRGKHITYTNAGTIAITLPQANGSGFTSGFYTLLENIGSTIATVTPTTSTINGASTLAINPGETYLVTSDSTNYRALPLGIAYSKFTGLTEDTAPDWTADFFLSQDISTTLMKKVKLQSLVATQALMEANTSAVAMVTPSVIRFAPGVVKAYVQFDASSATPTAGSPSLNFASFTDNGVGDYTFNFTTNFSAATYAPSGMSQRNATNSGCFTSVKQGVAPTTSAFRFMSVDDAAGAIDTPYGAVKICGDF